MCATGRELLFQLGSSAMMEDDENKKYLVESPRECEGYLLSLAIRTLYHSQKYTEAYELSNKTLLILDAHLKECEHKIAGNVGGLYPLRSRVIRYRSLVGEKLGVSVREDLAGRYRSAVLAKDSDGICTVLNLMLRDLLEGDQGKIILWLELNLLIS